MKRLVRTITLSSFIILSLLENRKLGVVAAVHGTMELQNQEKIDFWIEEEMRLNLYQIRSDSKFPHFRVIRLVFEDIGRKKQEEISTFFDELLIGAINTERIERWIPCQKCNEDGQEGFFTTKKFLLNDDDDMKKCSPHKRHHIPKKASQGIPPSPLSPPNLGTEESNSELEDLLLDPDENIELCLYCAHHPCLCLLLKIEMKITAISEDAKNEKQGKNYV